jgi:ribonuclease BN (tRNA processing enzyme)
MMDMNTKNSALSVTVLGSGTCVPSLSRSSCALRIQSSGANLLLDLGPGTMHRLLEAGTSIHDVDVVCFSHFHPDHSAELVPFLFANKYPEISRRTRMLSLVGGKGFSSFFRGLQEIYGHWITLGSDRMVLREMKTWEADRIRIGPFMIRTCPVQHNEESIAYRIEDEHRNTVVYSGDTDVSEDLVELAREVDLLVCESAMPDDWKVPGHLTPSRAGEIARRAGVGKLVLTHFYPECDTVDIESECRKNWDGPLILAEDLLSIEIGEG